MVHVFVVDQVTFKYHLEYLFAGTGVNKEDKTIKTKIGKQSPFLTNPSISNSPKDEININSTVERMLVGMIADISRIRIGDKIIFYLQSYDDKPGKFYGIFKVASEPFFDENNDKNYLKSELGIGLSFRVRILPDTVFSKGVTEHDYLDSLDGITHPYELCWSLIYRKLRANRGCTMITDFEFNRLKEKLIKLNSYPITGSSFSFDAANDEIITSKEIHEYLPTSSCNQMLSLNIKPRLLYIANNKSKAKYETHLQAYLTKNIDNQELKHLFLKYNDEPVWIGNEVACGVGMQRMDILLIQEKKDEVFLRLIELKCVEPTADIVDKQIPWYLEWLSYYYIPRYLNLKKQIFIIPTIIAKGSLNEELTLHYKSFSYSIPGTQVSKLEYIGFSTSSSDIDFDRYL